MEIVRPEDVQRGDRLTRWVYVGSCPGGGSHDLQELTVVRVNRVTYTVRTLAGGRIRVPHHQITGRADWPAGKDTP